MKKQEGDNNNGLIYLGMNNLFLANKDSELALRRIVPFMLIVKYTLYVCDTNDRLSIPLLTGKYE